MFTEKFLGSFKAMTLQKQGRGPPNSFPALKFYEPVQHYLCESHVLCGTGEGLVGLHTEIGTKNFKPEKNLKYSCKWF